MNKLGISFLTPLVVQHVRQEPGYRAIFTFTLGRFVFKGENMANTMQAGTSANLAIEWVDEFGNAAAVDGPTTWASSNETVLTLEVAADSNSAVCTSVGPIGPVQVQATADADLGTGIKSITATCDINVIAGEASGGTISFTPAAAGQSSPGIVGKVSGKVKK
jgi:hypothetical protein